jgi:dihydrofolate reductase
LDRLRKSLYEAIGLPRFRKSALQPNSSLREELLMMVSVFVGTSRDGFIARRNGEFDFLPAGGGEPHGYDEFIATVDVIVMGRGTFEIVLKMSPWPYGEKRVVVLSSRRLDLTEVRGGVVEQMAGEPAEIVAKLAAQGSKHVYVDGGITVQGFLRAGLVQRLTITRVPVLIGDGIPLFGSLARDVQLRHLGTRQYASGLVTSEYEVVP